MVIACTAGVGGRRADRGPQQEVGRRSSRRPQQQVALFGDVAFDIGDLPVLRWTRDRPGSRRWTAAGDELQSPIAAVAAVAARQSSACASVSQAAITVECLQSNALVARQFAVSHGKMHRWWRDDIYERGRRALKRNRLEDAARLLSVALFMQRMPESKAQTEADVLGAATLDTIQALGEVMYRQKRYPEALALLRQAVSVRQALPGGDGIALGKARETLARVYAALGNVPQLTELLSSMGNTTSEDAASRSRVIGLAARLAKRDLDAALRERWAGHLVSRVARLRREVRDASEVSAAMMDLARFYTNVGDAEGTKRWAKDAERQTNYGEPTLAKVRVLLQRGLLLVNQHGKNCAPALPSLERAAATLDDVRALHPENAALSQAAAPTVGGVPGAAGGAANAAAAALRAEQAEEFKLRFALGACYQKLGRRRKAKRSLTDALRLARLAVLPAGDATKRHDASHRANLESTLARLAELFSSHGLVEKSAPLLKELVALQNQTAVDILGAENTARLMDGRAATGSPTGSSCTALCADGASSQPTASADTCRQRCTKALVDLARTLLQLAEMEHKKGSLLESERIFSRSIELLVQLVGADRRHGALCGAPPLARYSPCGIQHALAKAYKLAGSFYSDRGMWSTAVLRYRSSIKHERQVRGDSQEVATSLGDTAMVYLNMGQGATAGKLLDHSLQMLQGMHQRQQHFHRELARAHTLLAQFLANTTDFGRAEQHLRTALHFANVSAVLRASHGERARLSVVLVRASGAHGAPLYVVDDADVSATLSNLAQVHVNLGHQTSAEALEEGSRLMAQRLAAKGSGHGRARHSVVKQWRHASVKRSTLHRYSFVHVVPTVPDCGECDISNYQRMTLHSMRIARDYAAKHGIAVTLLRTRMDSEPHPLPEGFGETRPLNRSHIDHPGQLVGVHYDAKTPRLPLLRDVLDRAHESSSADYAVFTNLDIALFPDFYVKANAMLNTGPDALQFTRLGVPHPIDMLGLEKPGPWRSEDYKRLVAMDPSLFKRHPGTDCMVFPRVWVPCIEVGASFLGCAPVGKALWEQIERLSETCNAKTVGTRYARFTFHLNPPTSLDPRKHASKRLLSCHTAESEYRESAQRGRLQTAANKKCFGFDQTRCTPEERTRSCPRELPAELEVEFDAKEEQCKTHFRRHGGNTVRITDNDQSEPGSGKKLFNELQYWHEELKQIDWRVAEVER